MSISHLAWNLGLCSLTWKAFSVVPFAGQDELNPASASDLALSLVMNLTISSRSSRFYLMFNEVYAQRYFGTMLRPLWRRHGTAPRALEAAHRAAERRHSAAEAFDEELHGQLAAHGAAYAELGALVYRQVMGATATAWNERTQEPWPFMKEISSDGDVSTVDAPCIVLGIAGCSRTMTYRFNCN